MQKPIRNALASQLKTPKFQAKRSAFTLVQLVVSMGILSMMATLLFSAFSDGRATARRTQCDARLKAIALALDAHRVEYGVYPAGLQELRNKHFLHDGDALHCPADVRDEGTYGDFYVIRAPHDEGELPNVVCPFHENQGGVGAQAFKGTYTKQFMARPAVLERATGTTVERPGQSPISGIGGTILHGGDRIRTTAGGSAVIRFFDTSSCELSGNADLTVLESFVAGTSGSTLYTLVRQSLGTIIHRVNHGSKFDVATPTATAGALGTAYRITINPDGSGTLYVLESRVYVSTQQTHFIVPAGSSAPLSGAPRGLNGLSPNVIPTPTPVPPPTLAPTATPTPRPTATPRPAATPTPRPTPTRTPCVDDHNHGHGNGGECD